MSAFVLHVSRPPRQHLSWTVPEPVSGQEAHYLYDGSMTVSKSLSAGSRVYLWGTKRIGRHGLFASGVCLKPKDPALTPDKNYDAFMLFKHDQVLATPISPGEMGKTDELKSIVDKLAESTLLAFFQLDKKQEQLLDQALLNASRSNQAGI